MSSLCVLYDSVCSAVEKAVLFHISTLIGDFTSHILGLEQHLCSIVRDRFDS